MFISPSRKPWHQSVFHACIHAATTPAYTCNDETWRRTEGDRELHTANISAPADECVLMYHIRERCTLNFPGSCCQHSKLSSMPFWDCDVKQASVWPERWHHPPDSERPTSLLNDHCGTPSLHHISAGPTPSAAAVHSVHEASQLSKIASNLRGLNSSVPKAISATMSSYRKSFSFTRSGKSPLRMKGNHYTVSVTSHSLSGQKESNILLFLTKILFSFIIKDETSFCSVRQSLEDKTQKRFRIDCWTPLEDRYVTSFKQTTKWATQHLEHLLKLFWRNMVSQKVTDSSVPYVYIKLVILNLDCFAKAYS